LQIRIAKRKLCRSRRLRAGDREIGECLVRKFRGRARIAAGDVFCGELQKKLKGRASWILRRDLEVCRPHRAAAAMPWRRGAGRPDTHATHEKSVRQALEAAVADGFLAEKPQVIRIERE
jgi:hypothetical protein